MHCLKWLAITILMLSCVLASFAQAQEACDEAAIEAECEEADAAADKVTSDASAASEAEAEQAVDTTETVEATPENTQDDIRNAEATDTPTVPVNAQTTSPAPTEPSLEERIRQGQAQTLAERDKDTADLRRREEANPCFQDEKSNFAKNKIRLVHSGAYIAEFFAEWESACARSSGRWQSGQKTAGYAYDLYIPISATRVKLRATNQTGLVWAPNRTIFDLSDAPAMLNKCFEIGGTTLGSNMTYCK